MRENDKILDRLTKERSTLRARLLVVEDQIVTHALLGNTNATWRHGFPDRALFDAPGDVPILERIRTYLPAWSRAIPDKRLWEVVAATVAVARRAHREEYRDAVARSTAT